MPKAFRQGSESVSHAKFYNLSAAPTPPSPPLPNIKMDLTPVIAMNFMHKLFKNVSKRPAPAWSATGELARQASPVNDRRMLNNEIFKKVFDFPREQ